MQTAGRRWQDSSLYADPLIPNRENPRARASLTISIACNTYRVYGTWKTGESEELEEDGTAYELKHEAAESERNERANLRSKSKVIIRGNGLWMSRLRRVNEITFLGNIKRGRRST